MKINYVSLDKQSKDQSQKLLKIFRDCLNKSIFVNGDEVSKFERKVSRKCGTKYAVALNSGTDALTLALKLVGIKKGDEVITPPNSFISSTSSIIHLGAKPVFVDTADDQNIDANKIEKKITKKTKAIVPVHWTGRMCDMDQLIHLSKKYNIKIIEDAAQAMGSYYKNIHAGKFSKVAAFSCHPLKNLNALGDSGFITTDDKKIYEKINLYKNHGLKSRDNVEILGLNSRLDTLNSCVLSIRLKKLKNIIKKRNSNIKLYQKYIKTDQVRIIPKEKNQINSSVIFNIICKKRNELKKYLDKFNIQTLIYYGKPLHLHKPMRKFGYKKGDFPIAEKLCNQVLALPHNQYITKEQIKFISNKINNFYNKFN